MKRILAINIGSSSKKYLLANSDGDRLYSAHFESVGEAFVLREVVDGIETRKNILQDDFNNAVGYVFNMLREYTPADHTCDIDAVAVRIVAPSRFFQEHRLVDTEFIERLHAAQTICPIHISPILAELMRLQELPCDQTKIIGISDSVFHNSILPVARRYPIPYTDTTQHELEKFGYHGISISSVMRRRQELGEQPPRIIVCHLGSGVSVSAVLVGKSIDTSMGYTPLAGTIMGTRSGNLDPGLILALQKKKGMTNDVLQDYLYRRCGLLGISGQTSDIRQLLSLESDGNKRAADALESWTHSVAQNIVMLAITLGSVDEIILTGTIGERSAEMRKRILAKLNFIGVKLSPKKNQSVADDPIFIHSKSSQVSVAVIPSDEVGEMVITAKGFC